MYDNDSILETTSIPKENAACTAINKLYISNHI